MIDDENIDLGILLHDLQAQLFLKGIFANQDNANVTTLSLTANETPLSM